MRLPVALALIPTLALLAGCTELRQLRERTDIQQREIARLRGEVNRWQEDYYELHGQYGDLTERFETDVSGLQAENNRLRTSLSDRELTLENEVQRLTGELRLAQTQVATLTSDRETLSLRAEQLDQNLSQAERDRQSLRQTLDGAEQDLSTYDTQLASALSDSERAQAIIAELQGDQRTLRAEVTRLTQENDDLRGGGGFPEAELARIGGYIGDQFAAAEGPRPAIARDPQRGVIVTFRGGDLFESGSTVVRDPAQHSLTILGYALAQLPETSVEVVGHTDNEPVSIMAFRDNWQLSASRAENVMRVLIDEGEVPPARCRFAAQGEHRPLESNSTLDGRRSNRRVEIIIAPGR